MECTPASHTAEPQLPEAETTPVSSAASGMQTEPSPADIPAQPATASSPVPSATPFDAEAKNQTKNVVGRVSHFIPYLCCFILRCRCLKAKLFIVPR